MKKSLKIIIACTTTAILNSCNPAGHDSEREEPKGGVHFGGTLRVNEHEAIKNLMPIAVNELNSYHVASQVYEGLVKYNAFDLSIEPALAQSWDISPDKTEYIFHLRNGVKFHDDSCFADYNGREVAAEDVKHCFEKLCSRSQFNTQYDITFKDRVEGASDCYLESTPAKPGKLIGVTVVDEETVKIKLLQPDANFLNILAMPGCYIYPKEAEAKYGKLMQFKAVGTGPFYITEIKPAQGIKMKRNPNYWGRDKDGNQLPYADAVSWSFINNRGQEMSEFNVGKLDMVYNVNASILNTAMAQISGKPDFDIFSSPALTTEYYCFNVQVNPFFSIKEIRRAFNLAVDREKIMQSALNGQGRLADHGLVPYTNVFEKNGYDYKILKAYPYNPDSARKLLALVGYVDGKGLPDFNLEINNAGSDRNIRVATEVQKMLKDNIGVKVNISVVSWAEHIENVQTGKSDFFRYSWVSDYPDPESFLTLFYGRNVPENFEDRSYINLGHFKNSVFDSLYTQARTELDKTKRYGLYSKAEKILLDEAALMPLFYAENVRLVKKNVKNLAENPLNHLDLSVAHIVQKKDSTLTGK